MRPGHAILPRSLLLALLLLPVAATPLWAQDAAGDRVRLRVGENFRAEQNGTLLGTLRPGVELRLEERAGQWLQVTLEAWIWTRSLQNRDGGAFDLVVVEEENIRAAPSGSLLGRLEVGTLLEEVERVPGWIRFRRTGWLWAPSAEVMEASEETEERSSPTPDRWVPSGPEGSPLLSGPDGDTLARVAPGSQLRVLAREGNWARVRLEGWVWRPGSRADAEEEGDTVVLGDVRADQLAGDPERFTGRVISLSLQFVSLERAERVRTDFFEGEPFLLTRAVDGERPFVYVAVPPDRVGEVEGITPLERITVVGRIRTVAADLTGNPILELLDLYRPGG